MQKPKPFTKISINIPTSLLTKLKFAAIYTNSTVSDIIRIAAKEKLERLKKDIDEAYLDQS